jgi:murein DD-endopeptidase MepM/ murein hydrolase activator NlpD
MSLYLIKSCVYIIAFYIPFMIVLKRTTFFNVNRVYLVSGLLFSFVLPLYTGSETISQYAPKDLSLMEPIVAQTQLVISPTKESTGPVSTGTLLFIFYLVGIIVRLIMLALSIADILKLKKQGEILVYRDLTVFKTNSPVPFTFFNYVFLPRSLEEPGILQHEGAHVRQYHWIDLLIVELASVILWFNPVMTVYKRSLKQQHEYLADRTAINGGIDIGEYLTTIKQQIELATSPPLTSEFYFQSIKNRINMMTRRSTSVYGLAAYTIVLPFIVCLLMAFSPRRHFQILNHDERDSLQEQLSLCLPIDKKNGFLLESGYGERMHPILGVVRMHTGIDLSTEEGAPVVSTQEGIVVKAELVEDWGNIIIVQHDGGYSTSYSHLKSMNVKEGDKVQKGEKIGLVGHTGLSTKDHLHFELLKNGKAIDPIEYLPKIK